MGNYYLCCSKGLNNSLTIYWYLLKLACLLERRNPAWRETTVIVLDLASYHKSTFMLSRLEKMKIPILFLGPFSYDLDVAESFFAQVKQHEIGEPRWNMNNR